MPERRPADPMNDAEYDAATRAVLAQIESAADRMLQDDVVDIDAGRTGGLLELRFPGGSTIVVNTQPPLQELWLAARSGGFHFRRTAGVWREREGREFFAVLSQCASEASGRPIRFDAG